MSLSLLGVLMLHLELWMIGEDPSWFQTSLLVIWSNFCFTNILVCWLFLGQDWRGPYAPFGVVDDRSRWPGDPIWFQTSLLVIWSNFCFTNILISWLFLGQDWRGPYAPFGVVNDRRGWPGDPTWFQTSLFVIWSSFCFQVIALKGFFLGIAVKFSLQEHAHPPKIQVREKNFESKSEISNKVSQQ